MFQTLILYQTSKIAVTVYLTLLKAMRKKFKFESSILCLYFVTAIALCRTKQQLSIFVNLSIKIAVATFSKLVNIF